MLKMVVILQTQKVKLEHVVKDLEDKIRLLEQKISQISTIPHKSVSEDAGKIRILKSNLVRVQRQNRDLVNKVKDLQFQLQGMVDKLRKEKKKVSHLHHEFRSFKSTRQSEIKELQAKVECSGKVIERMQNSSVGSDAVTRLQREISAINKLMMENRVSEQRMMRARSIEEVNKFHELDREKSELEKKLQEAKLALDGYSCRLKQNVSRTDFTSSQLSLNMQNDSLFRDVHLSRTIQALEESQKTSVRQNERLLYEKKELQSLVGQLSKSQEDLRSSGDAKLALSCGGSSSSSSLSSLCSSVSAGVAFHGNCLSTSFSFFD